MFIGIQSFFEERQIGSPPKTVKVIVQKMDAVQATHVFPYRPFSKYAVSYYGGDNLVDDMCLLLNERAKRCKMCQAPTRLQYLENDTCPDCDGRSEYNGRDPHLQLRR
jgi:hypothetical protein